MWSGILLLQTNHVSEKNRDKENTMKLSIHVTLKYLERILSFFFLAGYPLYALNKYTYVWATAE